jgi:hypothetical protein
VNKHNAGERGYMTDIILQKQEFCICTEFTDIYECFGNLSHHLLLQALLKYKISWHFLPNSVQLMFDVHFLPN